MSLHTQLTLYNSPPIHYIHLYKSIHRISPLHCELQFSTVLYSRTVSRSCNLNVLSYVGNTGYPTLEIVVDVRSTMIPKSLEQVKNNRPRARFPTIITTKKSMFLWRHAIICTKCFDRSLLETLRERVCFYQIYSCHVESNGLCYDVNILHAR